MSAAKLFLDEFKAPRDVYRVTKFPIILCHGLLGFSTLELPTGLKISYFNGVKEALQAQGAKVIARSVPPIASIELRANALYNSLRSSRSEEGTVNIIAHSMGGLDARYMLSKLLKPGDFRVASLTTLSTPHRGSPVADLFKHITRLLPPSYGAFSQLTTEYMEGHFNKTCKDNPETLYFSYGTRIKASVFSPFYLSGKYIQHVEGDNDGMVSVKSAQWGKYLGTIENVDHADVINLTRIKPRKLLNHNYSSPAMYLSIMDSLAKLGF